MIIPPTESEAHAIGVVGVVVVVSTCSVDIVEVGSVVEHSENSNHTKADNKTKNTCRMNPIKIACLFSFRRTLQ